MIDLDGLKAVNDSFGHHRGDDVLRRLGGVIRRSIRAVDTAYRYGGDEFLVLLPETDFSGAFVVAEKVRAGAEEVGLAVGAGELLTSVSIGLVSCPEDGASAEELMIAVDRAMYQAKSLGKNQISGNPRPRRIAGGAAPGGDEVAALRVDVAGAEPMMTAAAAEPVREPTPVAAAPAAASAQAVQAEPAPFVARGAVPPPTNGAHDPAGDDEPDPSEVRRHIAAARLNLDPDHQIRRAMDAFLSPPSRRGGDD
jgi:diguanylate cyclase (GGDEF)-like protein